MASLTTDLTRLGLDPETLFKAAQDEFARRRKAAFYLDSPFLFQRDVLCPEDKRDFLCKFHEEGLDFVQGGKRKKLILWPRGHLKSTIYTQGETLRRAIKNPNIRVLLNSSVVENAESFLSAIKGYLRSPELQRLYGDLLPGTKTGKYFKNNSSQLTLTSRSNLSLKEPTFQCSGLDSTVTSQHYDLIVHDDIIVRDNVGTFDMMDKAWTLFQDSLDLLEPNGTLWVIGTRWHPLDVYGRILSDFVDHRCAENDFIHVPGCSCDFDVTLKEITDPKGQYIFNTKFDAEIADELLRQKGNLEFAAQYRNNPADPSAVWFPTHRVAGAEVAPEVISKRRDSLVWYMAVDPAESIDKRSSFTAIVAAGIDPATGEWFVDYARQCRVETPQFVEAVFDARRAVKPHIFGMETHTRKALEWALRDRMDLYKDHFMIQELKPMLGNTPEAKKVRIKRLIPLFEYSKIHVNKLLKDLLQQLYTIPAATSWDLCDALSYILDMCPKGTGTHPEKRKLPHRIIHWKKVGF